MKAWVNEMQEVVEASRYVEGRDLPNIPLNTSSPTFNAWRALRPRSMDPPREPGAVSLGRYGYSGGFGGNGGPPTFGGYPLALTMEDLVAAEVDVAIVGAPLNMGSRWRDSGRQATTDMRLYGWPMREMDQYAMVSPGREMNIVDYGDVAIDNDSTERSMQHVRDIVREIAATGAIPVVIGGGQQVDQPDRQRPDQEDIGAERPNDAPPYQFLPEVSCYFRHYNHYIGRNSG